MKWKEAGFWYHQALCVRFCVGVFLHCILNQLTEFHETWYEHYAAIKRDHKAYFF